MREIPVFPFFCGALLGRQLILLLARLRVRIRIPLLRFGGNLKLRSFRVGNGELGFGRMRRLGRRFRRRDWFRTTCTGRGSGGEGRWFRRAAPAAAFPSPSADGPRPSAPSTEARRSTSIRSGWPEEYSAWNITFQDWQIMRRRMIGSCAENCARRQSMVSTPFSSSSVRPSRMLLRSVSMRRKNARRMRYPKRVNATSATGR